MPTFQPRDARRPSGRLIWCVLVAGVGLLLAAAALPLARRELAVRTLRRAGMEVVRDRSALPAWLQSLTGDLLAPPTGVLTKLCPPAGSLSAFGTLGELELLELEAGPGTIEILNQQPAVRDVTLRGPQVTDDLLARLPPLPQLESLALLDGRVTAAGLKHLSKYPRLTYLSLAGTPLDTTAVQELTTLSTLTRLELHNTGAQESAVNRLRETHPAVEITDD